MTSHPPAAPGSAGTRRRRRRLVTIVPLVLAVSATVGLISFTRLSRTQSYAPVDARPQWATAQVTRGDLIQRVNADATIDYGQTTRILGRKTGTLTWLPRLGAVIGRGQRLYAVDAVGVPLLFGNTPTYRALSAGVSHGPDVVMLQQNLVALGYLDADRADGEFGAQTTRALRRWQKHVKLSQTGRLQPADVEVLPGPVRVDSVSTQLGATGSGELMKVTGTERIATAELELSQRQLARERAKVRIELTDGRTTPGTVRTVSTSDPGQGDDKKAKLIVTIGLDDAALAATIEAGPASVQFSGAQRRGVLSVPVEALLALREGGYAVQVADGARHRLVAVRLGLFADGKVEVSGAGLTEGTPVVTAS
jgi:peptidoglycan hydrolase-like protein with peptidoglycan-binding domain